jgi:hypothetical protein
MPHLVEPADATADGTFEPVAATGDTIAGTIVGILVPSADPLAPKRIVVTATITGGTGRFAAVTGGFTIERLYDRISDEAMGTSDGLPGALSGRQRGRIPGSRGCGGVAGPGHRDLTSLAAEPAWAEQRHRLGRSEADVL